MINLDLTLIFSFLGHWMRLTFFEVDLDYNWHIVRLGGLSCDLKEDTLSSGGDCNLFYFHNSSHLFQIDLFFFNLYTKFKK